MVDVLKEVEDLMQEVEEASITSEELRDEENVAAFKKDVEEANVFIGSLIFVQELAEARVGVPRLFLPGPPRGRQDAGRDRH